MSKAVSTMAGSLIGSEVLKIAAEISALITSGKKIINFTVGDFDPRYFPIPKAFEKLIEEALAAQQTNYPPSSGLMVLREAVAEFYSRSWGQPVKPTEVLIAGGARPLIYTIFTTLLNPGDKVVYPVPSWNNNHYVHLARAEGVALSCPASQGFLPTADDLRPHLPGTRLLCLNSPLNPTGTVFTRKNLQGVAELLLEENRRREALSQPPLYLMYDQIYWMLTYGAAEHLHPVQLVPELKPYTIFVDGISKYFCATGLRVGWSILPESLMPTFSSVLGHVGAWAPKPEQMATAQFLRKPEALESFLTEARAKIERRLRGLYQGLEALKARGLPVDAIEPQGGIYLSLQIKPNARLRTNEDIRRAVLNDAGVAIIPFQAFGLKDDSGWFRLSVGAVSEADIPVALERLEKFLESLRQ